MSNVMVKQILSVIPPRFIRIKLNHPSSKKSNNFRHFFKFLL